MARPGKSRFICKMPRHCRFTAAGNPVNGINLAVEEYETIRLMDYNGLTQAQCAQQMNVSRATVQTLYTQARKKLARFLVEGTYMEISGGNYQLCQGNCQNSDCMQPMAKMKNKGEKTMKIAVTYENGQVFQHFGHTEQFKIYSIEGGKAASAAVVDTNGSGHGALAGFLQQEGVDTLICGGIGGGARQALTEAGIQLFGGVSGSADEAVAMLLSGNLAYDPEAMCSHHGEHHGDACGNHGCGEHHCGE